MPFFPYVTILLNINRIGLESKSTNEYLFNSLFNVLFNCGFLVIYCIYIQVVILFYFLRPPLSKRWNLGKMQKIKAL